MQAKHYATNVSVDRPDIQAFVGSLMEHGSSKGVFVNTSSFSTQAMVSVCHLSQRVILLGGITLADLIPAKRGFARTDMYHHADEGVDCLKIT
ncbi:restriction endonuclease [Acetobacter okinawensis]|uniref:restriction endonuclease n=1 Tax=Acetobacter okinawensis TaxID=1076594 RepID=UPI0039EBD081